MEIIVIRQRQKLRESEILIRHRLITQIIMLIVVVQLLLVVIEKVVHRVIVNIIHALNGIIVIPIVQVAILLPIATVIPILLIVQTVLGIGLMVILIRVIHLMVEIATAEQRLRGLLLGEVRRVAAQAHQVVVEVHQVVVVEVHRVVEAHVDRDNINKTLTPEIPQKSISGGFLRFKYRGLSLFYCHKVNISNPLP